jgi:hypothetical protein
MSILNRGVEILNTRLASYKRHWFARLKIKKNMYRGNILFKRVGSTINGSVIPDVRSKCNQHIYVLYRTAYAKPAMSSQSTSWSFKFKHLLPSIQHIATEIPKGVCEWQDFRKCVLTIRKWRHMVNRNLPIIQKLMSAPHPRSCNTSQEYFSK